MLGIYHKQYGIRQLMLSQCNCQCDVLLIDRRLLWLLLLLTVIILIGLWGCRRSERSGKFLKLAAAMSALNEGPMNECRMKKSQHPCIAQLALSSKDPSHFLLLRHHLAECFIRKKSCFVLVCELRTLFG